jgi:hypothetical protein
MLSQSFHPAAMPVLALRTRRFAGKSGVVCAFSASVGVFDEL